MDAPARHEHDHRIPRLIARDQSAQARGPAEKNDRIPDHTTTPFLYGLTTRLHSCVSIGISIPKMLVGT